MIVEAIAAGLAAGMFGALVGLGGGILLVPALALLFGLPMSAAIPASLVGVVATAMGGTAMYVREGHTNAVLAVRAGCATVIGATVGARIAVGIPDDALQIAFSLLLLFIVWRMLKSNNRATADGRPSIWKAGGLFTGAGLLAGMLGVGGGVLNVPAIRLALRRPMLEAVATSTMIIAFTAGAGAATYAAAGLLQWPLAAGCATGAFVGARVGAYVAPRVSHRALQVVFLVVILYVAVEMGVRGFNLPWWR